MSRGAALLTALLLGMHPTPSPAAPHTAGRPLPVLFIRAQFPDAPMKLSDAEWKRRLTTLHRKNSDYWARHSYGTIPQITAEYTKVLQLPENSTAYTGGGNTHKLATAMRALAAAAGHQLASYPQLILSYPGVLDQPFGAAGLPGTVWLPGHDPYDGGMIHEFGHALGVGHANSVEGPARTIFPGERREGRDGLFMMGSDGEGREGDYSTINLPMRYRMGFLGDTSLTTVETTGTYRIFEFEKDTLTSGQKLALRINIAGADFWVTFAPSMSPRWRQFGSSGFTRGIIVHRLTGSITDILDFTPGSAGGLGNQSDYIDTRDGALTIGQEFTFPDIPVTLRPLTTGTNHGTRWIEVAVTMPVLAKVPLGAQTIKYDAGSETSSLAPGYTRLTPTGTTAPGGSWLGDATHLSHRDRQKGTSLERDFITSTQPATFEQRSGNGLWQVQALIGDHESPHESMAIRAEGKLLRSNLTRAAATYAVETFQVEVTDGALTLDFSTEGDKHHWILNALTLTRITRRP